MREIQHPGQLDINLTNLAAIQLSTMQKNVVYTNPIGAGVARLVASGKWLYAGESFLPVQIFAVNYDESYEIAKADNQLEEGESPNLNKNGEQHVIAWYDGNFFGM